MFVSIGRARAHTFDDPLGMMSDCHRRVERFLEILVRLAADIGGGPLDGDQRDALERALRYFRDAAPRHTADEEQSLFPRLRASHAPEVDQALTRLAKLEADHRTADPLHETVDRLGRSWLETGQLDHTDIGRMREALTGLEGIYKPHIALEDQELFPLARGLLTPEDLATIGREMAARRDIDPDAARPRE